MIAVIIGSVLGAIGSVVLFDMSVDTALSTLFVQLGTVALLYVLGYIKT
jgi:hypothetical protein